MSVVDQTPPVANNPEPEKKEASTQTYLVSSDLIFSFNSDKIYPAGEDLLGTFAKDLMNPPVFKNLEIVVTPTPSVPKFTTKT